MARLDNPATQIGDGRQEVAAAGTPEALAASTQPIRSLVVTACTDNTSDVTVGGSGIDGAEATRIGTPLSAGQAVSLDIDDLAKVYVDAITNDDGVTFTWTA